MASRGVLALYLIKFLIRGTLFRTIDQSESGLNRDRAGVVLSLLKSHLSRRELLEQDPADRVA